MSNRSNRTIGCVSRPARGARLSLVLSAVLIAGAVAGAGCARARAASVPPGPPLSVPTPPERVLVPVEAEEPRAAGPEPSEAPPAPPPARPEPPRPQPRRAETEPRSEPAAPAPAAPATAATEKPSLQIAPSPGESGASEKVVLAQLTRVTRAISQVDEARLSAPQRANLSEARSYERRAREFLTSRNYQAADAAAQKAVQLAESLVK